MSADGDIVRADAVSYEDLRAARSTIDRRLRLEYHHDGANNLFSALAEAKRVLGICVSLDFPERFDELMEEQG